MAWRVVWSSYGREAAVALRDAVAAAKGGEPLAPVTVVVPSNHVGVATRRLLASGALGPVTGGVGLAAVTFVTPYRLAELLAAPGLAGRGKRPVSTPVLAAAVRAELTRAPGLFRPVADHPATESALVATYRELRDLSPAALDALAGASDRAREVVRIHRAVRTALEPAWSDEEDLLTAATALAASPAAAELGALVVHLPQRLTQHSARLLAALAQHRPATVVAAVCGVPEADAEVVASLARMGVADPPPADAGRPEPVDAARTTIVTTSDADEEVRGAVRAVVDAVRAGTRLDRIAVLHASAEPYARLTHDQLHAAGIPTNGAAVQPLAARVAGRTLLELLALPEGGFQRRDVLAWLASATVLHDGRWAPTTAWERLSRDAAVVAGRDHWDTRLAQLADQQRTRLADLQAGDEVSEGRVEGIRRKIQQAEALRSFVLGVVDDLAAAAARPRPWSEHAAWAQRWVRRLLGDAARREQWSQDAERKAAERVEEALRRLGALDVVEDAVPLAVFHRTLEVELASDLGRVGRLGEGVLVGSVEMGIGLDLDLVVVLGLAEGSFPATVRDDSLLPDRERARTGGELALRADRVERQHRHLLAALSGADRQVLCVPRGDLRRSVERVPSRWVLDLARALADAGGPQQIAVRWWGADLHRARDPWVHHVASFDAGLRQLTEPATPQEHRLRALLAAGGSLAATDDDRTRVGWSVISARRSSGFTAYDGNLAGLPVPSPVAGVTSPTRLERWATCPFSHLVEDILAAAPVENPEEALVISPLEKGSLIHKVLEDFVGEVLAAPPTERPGPFTPWSAAHHRRIQALGEARCDEWEAQGLTGRPLFWKRDRRRLLADMHAFLHHDDVHRAAHGTTPVAAELGFGFGTPDESAPVRLPLPDGRTLAFRGRADRLDVAADGTLHVVDYKTGKLSAAYSAITDDDPVGAGTKLQLPVYGLAARAQLGEPAAPVRAEYWFVTRDGKFSRKGYDVTADVIARASTTVGVIVAGIEAGLFPAHPPASGSTATRVSCHACDPDGLGTVELRQHWERKRVDPAMAAYADLVEPLDRADGAGVPA